MPWLIALEFLNHVDSLVSDCYFDWFLLYWFTYSWGNSWLVFARRFPRSTNPDHFWRGVQGNHLGQLIQSGSQWVFVNWVLEALKVQPFVSCLHAQTGVHIAFLNCTICPNIHHAKVWASELELYRHRGWFVHFIWQDNHMQVQVDIT